MSDLEQEKIAASRIVKGIMEDIADADTTLVKRYQRGIMFFLRSKGFSQQDSEDICQEVFIAAIAAIKQGRCKEPKRLAGYLRGIAYNKAKELWRQLEKRETTEDPGIIDGLGGNHNDPESVALREELRIVVLKVLEDLPIERDKLLLIHRFLLGEDIRDICELLDIEKPEHFRKVSHRAKGRFLEVLRKADREKGLGLFPDDEDSE